MKIELYPESNALLEMAEPIETFNGELRDIADEMLELMRRRNGIGLAGNQVGILRRIFVMDIPDRMGNPYTIAINPVVCKLTNKQFNSEEGCLSIPGYKAVVRRWRSVEMIYHDVGGKLHCITHSGMQAAVVQHENDHLDGWLFPFYLIPIEPIDYFVERDPRTKDFVTLSDSVSLI
jgi:peptide deformylase